MDDNQYKRIVSVLLVLSTVLLAVLIPGGPIETRDFSHISPLVLGLFNSFLTILGMGGLVLVYFCWKYKHWAFYASLLCGTSYFFVYVLDLTGIFPTSPSAMPIALELIEYSGSIVSIPLMFYSLAAIKHRSRVAISIETGSGFDTRQVVVVVVFSIISVAIVTFATLAAMGK